MKYLPDAHWHHLIAQLVTAVQHPADPESAVAELICGFVAPESAREEIEAEERADALRRTVEMLANRAEDRAAFDAYVKRECRTPSGRLDMDAVIAEALAGEEKAA